MMLPTASLFPFLLVPCLFPFAANALPRIFPLERKTHLFKVARLSK